MRHFILAALLIGLLPGAVQAEEIAARNGAQATTTNGEIVITFASKKGEWPPAVGIPEKSSVVAGKKITLTFEVKATEAMPARIVVSEFAPPYTHLAGAESIKLGTSWQPVSLTFTVAATTVENVNLPLIVFESSPTSGEVRVRNIKASPAQ
ncbi:MAG: hypothetical protein B9S32_06975 [Verrucomicrobia bacterium Tous-C9LFEB]|nr:MAG: hypothetical protein B9S32_06975 [Verrucomicrobia bacterium Tous-C9LFEB]